MPTHDPDHQRSATPPTPSDNSVWTHYACVVRRHAPLIALAVLLFGTSAALGVIAYGKARTEPITIFANDRSPLVERLEGPPPPPIDERTKSPFYVPPEASDHVPDTGTRTTCLDSLNIPDTFVGSGAVVDPLDAATAVHDGALHLGTGSVERQRGAPLVFTPSETDALALAWTAVQHGVNPNVIAALAIEHTEYDCTTQPQNCFEISVERFDELIRQFPRAFRFSDHSTTTRSTGRAPQAAAFILRFSEGLFARWYDWAGFHTAAADHAARLKLLVRAYLAGEYDIAIRDTLRRDRPLCGAVADLLSCMPDDAFSRAVRRVAETAHALDLNPAYDETIPRASIDQFLRDAIRPFYVADIVPWETVQHDLAERYTCLENQRGRVSYARELPLLFRWLSDELPPIEVPQQLQRFFAP